MFDDRLWAPWRSAYLSILSEDDKDRDDKVCVFCAVEEKPDEAVYVVRRSHNTFIILNIYPYNNGHLMVIPYQHTSALGELSPEIRLEMINEAELAIRALKTAMNPDGFNVGMNLGQAAGAGIDKHLHFHIVPRWSGDTNFMPVLGQTKVLSEGLDQTLAKLAAAYQTLEG
ncbi:MAG: HIT domain-containing protein [Candidatus Latescibacteria bacterium]|jgi:ATP adenylyltransferase|nr:HIT domain-containing protein [Candidatus Latescibacterota bacterium]